MKSGENLSIPGLPAKPRKARKPRKKKAQLIAEAYEAGLDEGRSDSMGGFASLILGAFSGGIATLIFIALYHAMHRV